MMTLCVQISVDMDMLSVSHALQWLNSYLSTRQQYVVINGCASNVVHNKDGVPSGSICAPL